MPMNGDFEIAKVSLNSKEFDLANQKWKAVLSLK